MLRIPSIEQNNAVDVAEHDSVVSASQRRRVFGTTIAAVNSDAQPSVLEVSSFVGKRPNRLRRLPYPIEPHSNLRQIFRMRANVREDIENNERGRHAADGAKPTFQRHNMSFQLRLPLAFPGITS